ncbi:proteasome component M29 [Coemansia spiralis]|nr:proteasome component M29 [Coemansia spiralis]
MADAADIELIESLRLRFALAESDEQLQRLVTGLLVPLLDKLDVATAPVRAKAIGLLGQINKKLKGRTTVVLPTLPLLESTFGDKATGFSQGFRLMYVAMAMETAADEHLVAAIPLLLGAISSRPRSQQTILNSALLTAVSRAPELTEDQQRGMGLVDRLAQAEALVALSRDLFLYHGVQRKADGTGRSIPDGLCESRLLLVTNDEKAPWTEGGPPLQALKLRLVHIIGSGIAFPADMPAHVHELRLVALICAGADRYFQQVSERGKDALKRMCPVDAESPTFVQLAYASILGGPLDAGAENARTPVPAAVELKLLEYLSRSVQAVSSYDKWSRVVAKSVTGAKSPARLRQHGMAFLLWAINNAPLGQLEPEAAALVRLIWDVVRHIASVTAAPSASDLVLRGTAYVALGALVKRLPATDLDRLGQLEAMFGAFAAEPVDVRQSIQEGLLAMLPTYQAQTLPGASRQRLLALLQAQLESPVYQAGYCALRYAVAAFPFADMDARWLCILGLGNSKPGIVKLAQTGLKIDPAAIASSNVPHPREALPFLCAKASAAIDSSTLSARPGAQAGAANPNVYCGMLDFGRSILLAAGAATAATTGSESAADAADLAFVNDHSALATPFQRRCMRRALADSPAAGWVGAVYAMLSVAQLADPALLPKVLLYLVELLSLGSQDLSLGLMARSDQLLSLLDTRLLDAQLYAAQALSIVYGAKLLADARAGSSASDPFWSDKVPAQLHHFTAEATAAAQPKLLDKQRGSVVALGSLAHGLCVAQRASGSSWAELGLEPLGAALAGVRAVVVDGVCRAGEAGTHPTIAVAWCIAAGEIFRLGRAVDMPSDEEARVVEAASGLLKRASSTQVYDAALSLLADVALGAPAMAPELVSMLRQAAAAAQATQLDAHFRTGEALARALGRFDCTLAQVAWAFPVEPTAVYGENGAGANVQGLDGLLEAITTTMAKSAIKQERQAAAIWTLAVVQSCPGLDALGPWFAKLHSCMCMLLSDRSEQTQEVASRALGLIYNMADAALKEDMVYSLISLFGGGDGSGGRGGQRPGVDGDMANVQQALHRQIQSDEPLLEQESLGQTPDGHAVNTTYKSILSLASDMQNPSLVYQFMQLATHTALWNSRCGAAYGVANIIEQARDAIQPYMASMIPKLYRYTFDPSKQTRLAMKSIWTALVGSGAQQQQQQQQDTAAGTPSSESGIIARHWDAIIEECLASMSQREWKVRESGCGALASAVSGADPDMVVPYLDRIWQMSFRALDDIKGSVREAGLGACQAVASATVTWCTPQTTPSASREKQARAVVAVVVPFLVDKGVNSDAEDVRNFSMRLLLRLCKVSGRYLSSFVPAIVERLLESLSNMEAQAANYLTFHADSHGVSQEQLESLRLSAVKSSPMMQGIETVLEYLQPESIAELVPKLQHLIRHGLGLPTRAGCARTVVILCVKQTELVRPHASPLVKAISGSLAENSALQRQAWAAAIGYMAPMLSAGMFKSLLKHLEKVYFERYEDEARGVAGQVLEQLAQRCPERLCENPSGPGTASFVLFGCSDAAEAVAAAFQSAWREYMLGLGGKLSRTDLADLLGCAVGRIADSSWACRTQGAKAVASIARLVEREARASGPDDAPVPAATAALATLARTALPALMQATRGRPWPGKEHVLGAIVDVCAARARIVAPDACAEQLADLAAACEALVREMAQGEMKYRRDVVKHYCVLAEYAPPAALSRAAAVLLEITEALGAARPGPAATDGAAMDVDGDDSDSEAVLQRPQRLMLVAAAIDALRRTLVRMQDLDPAAARAMCGVLHGIACAGVWNVRVASLECLAALLGASAASAAGEFPVDVGLLLDAVAQCAGEARYVAVRTAALAALEAAVAVPDADSRAPEWRRQAAALLEQLAGDPAPSVAGRAKELLAQRL